MGMSKADFNKAVASAWAHVEWLGFDHWKAIRSITITNAEAMRIEKNKGLISEDMTQIGFLKMIHQKH